jgi:hypothetical protein
VGWVSLRQQVSDGREHVLLWGRVDCEAAALVEFVGTGEKKSRMLFLWGFIAENNRGVVMLTSGGGATLRRRVRRFQAGC